MREQKLRSSVYLQGALRQKCEKQGLGVLHHKIHYFNFADNKIFALLGCYRTQIGSSFPMFGTAY